MKPKAKIKTRTQPVAHDDVNHPRHFTSHPSGVECIEIVEHMGFCLGNTIKYIWRAGLKYDNRTVAQSDVEAARIKDLEKAAWYLQREISRLYSEQQRSA